jgi:hypothetical protein
MEDLSSSKVQDPSHLSARPKRDCKATEKGKPLTEQPKRDKRKDVSLPGNEVALSTQTLLCCFVDTNPVDTDCLGGGKITERPAERNRPHNVSVANTTWSRTSARTPEDHRCACTTASFGSASTAEVPIAASTTRCQSHWQVSVRNVEKSHKDNTVIVHMSLFL